MSSSTFFKISYFEWYSLAEIYEDNILAIFNNRYMRTDIRPVRMTSRTINSSVKVDTRLRVEIDCDNVHLPIRDITNKDIFVFTI